MKKDILNLRIPLRLFFIISVLYGILIALCYPAYPQAINFNVESTNQIDEKQKAKNLINFLTQLGASSEVIEQKLAQYDQVKVGQAITELKAEGKIQDKANSEVTPK